MLFPEATKWYPINGGMSSEEVLGALLTRLSYALEHDVPGEVVEMGCNAGTTSIFFQRLLLEHSKQQSLPKTWLKSHQLHVYDSFDGLPEPSENDNKDWGHRGMVKTSPNDFCNTFAQAGLDPPIIHKGWFHEIPECEFPKQVCFAFFDGDLYSSTVDSFKRIYHRLPRYGVVCVHDFNVDAWPGTKKACEDFLADKPERVSQVCGLLGEMVKL